MENDTCRNGPGLTDLLRWSLVVGPLYWALCRLSLDVAEYTHGIGVIWPAAGLGFAACRLLGQGILPAIFLGGLASAVSANTIGVAAGLALGDTLAVWVSNLLLNNFLPRGYVWSRTKNAVLFLFLGAAILGLVGGGWGVATLALVGELDSVQAMTAFWTWLLADATGVLVVAPFILVWRRYGTSPGNGRNLWTMAAVSGVMVFFGWVLYGHTFSSELKDYPLAFVFVPLLIWAAFRLGHRDMFTMMFLVTTMAVVCTIAGLGPFSGQPFPKNLLLMQVYLLVMNSMAMLIHAVVGERGMAMGSLVQNQDSMVQALASLAETRDNETGAHIIRTQNYVRILARALRDSPNLRGQIDNEIIELMYKTSALHDIGKVGVPDAILLKPGRLTPDEFEVIKKHTTMGYQSLVRAAMRTGANNSFLDMAAEIAYTHHEKWDGTGYPQGLEGYHIPLAGRIMALADVYDALVSSRIYKSAMSHAMAAEIIIEGRGRHFDPAVVDAFVATEHLFIRVARAYADDKTNGNGNASEAESPPDTAADETPEPIPAQVQRMAS